MQPNIFWNCTFREVSLFCKMRLIRRTEDLKQQIILQEAVTSKLIQAQALIDKPKVISLYDTFKELFKK